MPKIDRTERSVTTRATYQPYDTGRGGQAIGEGISRLGAAISSLGAAQDEQEMFDAKMKVSEYTFQKTKEEDDRIANYNPAVHGAPQEFDARYLQERQEQDAAFISQFSGRKAQQYAALQVQQNRHSTALRMQNARQAFVMQENIGRVGALGERVASTLSGDPESVGEGLATISGAIDAIPGLTPAQRNQLRAREADAMWKRWLQKGPTLEQQKRALQEFEAGVDKWRQKFEEDRPVGGDLTPGARNIRRDTELDGRTAAVRYNNPGAQYPSAAAEKFGMTGYGIIGGGHKIAMFPSDVHGGAANMDNFARNYKGLTFAEAVSKWRGGNGSVAVPAGFDPRARVDDAFLADRERMADFFDKMSRHEGRGRAGPVPRETWNKAFDMYRAGGIKAESARVQVGAAPLTGTPPDETGGGGPVVRQKVALPERATMGDHAINGFMDIIPALRKSIAEGEAKQAAEMWWQGALSGQVRVNPYDADGRKFIDQRVREMGIGQAITAGDGKALAAGMEFSQRFNYAPAPVWEGIKGLIDDKDPARQRAGYDTVLHLYDRNPNIFNVHGDDKQVLADAEYYRRLRRLYDPDKAIEIMRAEKLPENKLAKAASKEDTDKFMKQYKGENAASLIAKHLDEGHSAQWYTLWGLGGFVGQPQISGPQKAIMISDFRDVLQRTYEATGNENQAIAMAVSAFKQRYGVSSATGSERIMPYPPERGRAAGPDGTYNYIAEDLKKTVDTFGTNAVDGSTVIIPHGVGPDGRPAYQIQITRKDNGFKETLPVIWYPPTDPGTKEAFDKERAEKKGKPGESAPKPSRTIGEIGQDAAKGILAPVRKGIDAIREGVSKERPPAPLTIDANAP